MIQIAGNHINKSNTEFASLCNKGTNEYNEVLHALNKIIPSETLQFFHNSIRDVYRNMNERVFFCYTFSNLATAREYLNGKKDITLKFPECLHSSRADNTTIMRKILQKYDPETSAVILLQIMKPKDSNGHDCEMLPIILGNAG